MFQVLIDYLREKRNQEYEDRIQELHARINGIKKHRDVAVKELELEIERLERKRYGEQLFAPREGA